MHRHASVARIPITAIFVLLTGVGTWATIIGGSNIFDAASASLPGKQPTTLTAILDDLGDKNRWTSLFENALEELRTRHPDLNIKIDYKQFAYPNERT
jgi:hypothetical protein